MNIRHISTILFALVLSTLQATAQEAETKDQTQVSPDFCGHLYNYEYDVFMVIDFNKKELIAPEHELYGPLAGYLGRPYSKFYWVMLTAEVKEKTATMQLVNDYGSEDLMATLSQLSDSTYRFTQGKGSVIKVPNKGKWLKLPKTLVFKKKTP